MKITQNKICAIVISLIMIIAIMSTSVFAVSSLTINDNSSTGASAERTYSAYELFKIDNVGTEDVPLYKYSFADTKVKNYFMADENKSKYGITGTETDDSIIIGKIVETLSGYTDDDSNMKLLAEDMYTMATSLPKNSNLSNLPEDGYYYVVDEGNLDPKSRNIIVPVIGNSVIEVKADLIPFTKELVTSSDKTATVGDEIEFKITSKVPDTTGFKNTDLIPYNFIITDNMTNLEYVENTLEITIGDSFIPLTDIGTDHYTISASSIEVNLGNYLYLNNETLRGKTLVVTYTAKITESASITNSSTNEAKLVYTTDPNTGASGEEEQQDIDIYNFNINLAKQSILGTALNEATFKLKYGTQYILAASNENTYNVTGTTTNANDATIFTAGTATIRGLGDGDYTLEEITAPEGYTIAPGLTFSINVTDDLTVLTGTITPGQDASNYISATGTVTVTKKTETADAQIDGSMDVTIIDSKATLLPTTGGIGTRIFTIVGICLMLGVTILFIFKNRKKFNK